MTTDESLAVFGLVPTDEALSSIRELLAREAQLEQEGGTREEDLALLCCVQLFASGRLEDTLRIWAAKRSGMDLGAYIDVQLLCGAGLTQTMQFLASQSSELAVAALKYLQECEAAGDFVDFTPEGHLAHYRAYFGVG